MVVVGGGGGGRGFGSRFTHHFLMSIFFCWCLLNPKKLDKKLRFGKGC